MSASKKSVWGHNHTIHTIAPMFLTVMLMKPSGHEAKAEATMYEVEARHVREQLSVYEHEDY